MKTLIAVSVLSILSFGAHAERQSNEPIKVIEPISGLDSKKIELGKTLWFEPRLSASNTFLATLAITSLKVALITYQAQLVTNGQLAQSTHLRCLIQI